MPSSARLFRIAAVLLLLVTGVDLATCELLSAGGCESFGEHSGGADDACVCCCRHVVVAPVVRFEPTEEAVTLEPPPALHFASYEATGIYHPPKA